MQLITLTEIANLHNAVLFPYQVEELSCNKHTMKVPVFILSTREPKQIKEWWDKQGFSMKAEIINSDETFFKELSFVGITRTKLPAQIYVDDRAYCYTGQTVKEFLLDFTNECME